MTPKICPECKAEMKKTSSSTYSPTASGGASGSLTPRLEHASPTECFDSSSSYEVKEKVIKTYWLCPKCGYAEDSD